MTILFWIIIALIVIYILYKIGFWTILFEILDDAGSGPGSSGGSSSSGGSWGGGGDFGGGGGGSSW